MGCQVYSESLEVSFEWRLQVVIVMRKRLSDPSSVFQAELTAVMTAASWLLNSMMATQSIKIHILTANLLLILFNGNKM